MATNRISPEDAHRLTMALGRTARRVRAVTSAGRSPSQLRCLASIVRDGPLRASQLATLDDINPTAVSRIIARLEEDGLISRATDPDDGRACVLVATRKGRRLVEHVMADRIALLTERVGELDPQDARALVAALPALEALALGLAENMPGPRTER
jgi:DNA-binding MarR family transcriptional regulator